MRLSPLLLGFLLAIPGFSCGGDEPAGGTADLTGRVSSDWSVLARASLLDRASDALFGGRAHAVGGTMVDTAVAIPVGTRDWSDAIEVPLAEDGTFEFDFGEDRLQSWLILLVHRAAPLEERIVAYVSMGAGDDTMMAFPPIEEPLALGTVSRRGDEAVSGTRVEESTTSFTLSVDELLAVAATDDAYKPLINGYLNYDRDTGTFFDPQMTFRWQGSMATFLRGEAAPEVMVYEGYYLDIRTNGLGDAPAAICDGTQSLALHPPEEVRNVFGRAWAPEAPIESGLERGATAGSHCAADIQINDDGGGSGAKALNFAEGRLADLGEGYWSLRLGGETVAAFDLGVRHPNEGGTIRVPVPVPDVTTNAAGAIERVSLRWFLNDGDGFAELDDPTRLERVLERIIVGVSDEAGAMEDVGLDSTLASISFEQPWVLTDARFGDDGNARSLGVSYWVGGNVYGFYWGPSELEPVLEPQDAIAQRPAPGETAAAEVVVTINRASAETVTVNWQTLDDTATAAAGDYATSSGTLTFAPGTVSQTVTVPLPSPSALQPEAALFVELSNPAFASLGRARAPVRLVSAAQLTIATTEPVITEGDDLVIEVRLAEAVGFDTGLTLRTFPNATAAREAEPSVDFERTDSTVTIPAGETLRTVIYPTTIDGVAEGPEVILIRALQPVNAQLASTVTSATLLDSARSDFRLEAPVRGAEGDEVTVTVRTDSAPSAAVPMSVSYDGPTFTDLGSPAVVLDPTDLVGGFGPSPFMFPAGTTSHTFTFTPAMDEAAEADEPLLIVLTHPTGAAPSAQQVDAIAFTIQDTGSLVTATCSAGEEGGAPAVLQLAWTAGHAAGQPVVVSFETVDGSATGGVDYATTIGQQAFFDDPFEDVEEAPLYVMIPVVDDLEVEDEERFTVRITGPAGLRVSPETLECAVVDDDGR